MAESEDQLKRMVMTFRVSELQMLLGYAGKNKTGRKNELQSRALDIVRLRNPTIQQKIKELYKSIQLEMMSFGDRGQGNPGGAPGNMIPGQRVPSGLTSMAPTYSQPGNLTGNLGVNANPSVYSTRNSSSQISPALNPYNMQSTHNSYPISPDVRLKKLPFYDILGELLKPSTLAPHGSGRYQEATFNFSLTPQQANKIAHSRDLRPGKQDYTVQVQMRFCLLETTCEQEDNFPPNITVKINDKMCPLPSPIPTNKQGVEPKRPPRPVNVTALCKISPTVSNRILVSWSSEFGRCYVISVYLVQKLTSEDLLHRLKSKGHRLPDFTRSLIKQKLREDGECEIATTSLRCSLLCPLGKMRMVLPCRAETCNHLQCFDASLFLQMNERKPTWMCPVCDKQAVYDTLVIDGYFQEVLTDNSSCSEVTLHKDGDWTPLIVKKEQKEPQLEKRKSEVAVETLIDDSDDSDEDITSKPDAVNDDSVIEEVRSKRKNPDVEIITLSDSEDDCVAPPPSKRQAYQSSGSPLLPSSSPSLNTTSASTSTVSSSNSSGAGSSSNDAPGNGRGDFDATDNLLSQGSECTKSNDSWCVGEVDPGKRLIFRKSLSSTSNNGIGLLTPSNNSVAPPATSPRSSGSGSPQIICLDSPTSSPSPPLRRNYSAEPQPNTSTNPSPSLPASSPSAISTAASFASPTTSCESPALSTTNAPSSISPVSASVAASLASLGSELMPLNSDCISQAPISSSLAPVTITPVPPSLQAEVAMPMAPSVSENPYDMLSNPLASLNPLASGGIQNIFNPMALLNPNIAPSTSGIDWDAYGMSADRFL